MTTQPTTPAQAGEATAATPKPSTLGKFAIKQARPKCPRMLIYGQGGVGKTTLGAKFPDPLFICFESGLNSDALAGTPYIEAPDTWQEFLQLLSEIKNSPYKTIVIDTLDVMIGGIFNAYLCRKLDKLDHLGSFSNIEFGKGSTVGQQEIKAMLNRLDDLRNINKIILILAHTDTKLYQNPIGKDYDAFVVKGDKKINDVVKEWADEVYFASFTTMVDKDGKATTKGRWLDCETTGGLQAKSRFGFTGMELDAEKLVNAMREKMRGVQNV